MKLFRRLLMSLLPEEMTQHEMNPAGMFLSFVSPKHFFSVINRKIVENYKLNLFDIGLDSFEVKIGFGDVPSLEVKDLNFYYSYAVVANMNGWSFYSPSNIGVAVTMVVSLYVKEVFRNRHRSDFYNFLVTVNIMHFIFVSRIKVFPHDDKEKNYQRFIDVFFNFYRITLDSGKKKITNKEFEKLKKELLSHIHVFFMLFRVLQRLNTLFYSQHLSEDEFHQWILYDYQKKSKKSSLVKDFIKNATAYSRVSAFSIQDEQLIQLLLPTDMLIKYIFHHEHIYEVCDKMIAEIFDKELLDVYVMSFLKNDDKLEEYLRYIFDFRLYKQHYFSSMKRFISHTFRLKQNYEESQEKYSFINTLQNNEGKVDMANIPESLKLESAMTERFVNFYITFLAGTWVGKGDNFSMRLFEKPLLDSILSKMDANQLQQETLVFYGGMLYNYSKNVFYYKYAYENVRSGVDKFTLPMRPTIKEVYSNMFIIKLFDENFINTCFQDLNKRNLTMSIANKTIIELYKDRLGKSISKVVTMDHHQQFTSMYGNMLQMTPLIDQSIQESDFFARESKGEALRENLYTLDFWIRRDALAYINTKIHYLKEPYSELALMGIFASLRESLFGYVLYVKALEQYAKSSKQDIKLHLLHHIYLSDVVMVGNSYIDDMTAMVDNVLESYSELLDKRVGLDENQSYFDLGISNWMLFIQDNHDRGLLQEIKGEDIVRFRGFLKNISYYNKRYVMPN